MPACRWHRPKPMATADDENNRDGDSVVPALTGVLFYREGFHLLLYWPERAFMGRGRASMLIGPAAKREVTRDGDADVSAENRRKQSYISSHFFIYYASS